MMKNTNKLTSELFFQHESLFRELLEEGLGWAKEYSRTDWLQEFQDLIHLEIELVLLQAANDSRMEQAILEEMIDIEFDKIVEHLIEGLTIQFAE
jgi:hypothetical protein